MRSATWKLQAKAQTRVGEEHATKKLRARLSGSAIEIYSVDISGRVATRDLPKRSFSAVRTSLAEPDLTEDKPPKTWLKGGSTREKKWERIARTLPELAGSPSFGLRRNIYLWAQLDQSENESSLLEMCLKVVAGGECELTPTPTPQLPQ